MTTLWQVPVVVAALLTWLGTPPGTIGEAAEREALRRLLTPRAQRAYTNVDLAAAAAGSDRTAAPASGSSGPSAQPTAAVHVAAPPPSPVAQAGAAGDVRDEHWWRNRVASLRTGVERNEVLAEAMQSHVNTLTADVVRRDDPFQRAELRDQLQKALAEFDRLQALVIQGRQALETLQDDARRSNVPPGWLR